MKVCIGGALIGAGVGIGLTYLIAFALRWAATAYERRLAHLDDAPDLVDDLMAIGDVPVERNRSLHAAREQAVAVDDFELWRLECGWSS